MRRRQLFVNDTNYLRRGRMLNRLSLIIYCSTACFSCFFVAVVVGEVQIQRISDRIVPVPGGNVKGVIAEVTDDGPLKGRYVEQFYGIQFASVPERFLAPERPNDEWKGNRILWNPAPACPGPEYPNPAEDLARAGYNRVARKQLEAVIAASKAFDGDMFDWESTCLKMNIFVPYENRTANPKIKSTPRAVLVFIPAESYNFGSANAYNPTPLVALGDIIVVTLNIRSGALGFLATSEQSSASPPGNMALYDVVSSLHWIRANIAAFGGDPHRITLMGHQHAAAIVHLLMAAPVVRGNRLFQRAILLDGSALSPYAVQSLAAAHNAMVSLGTAAGCARPLVRQLPLLMRCLRNKPVSQLVNLILKRSEYDNGFQPLAPSFGPTMTSGSLLSIDFQELNEKRLPYDVLLGVSSNSGSNLVPDECLSLRGCNATQRMNIVNSLVKLIFHNSRPRIIDVLAHQYKDHRRPNEPDAIAKQLTKMLGDSYIVAPLIKTANIQSQKSRGKSVFFYVLDYGQSPIQANSNPLGTPNVPVGLPGDELAYIFGAPLVSNLRPYAGRTFFPEERYISKNIMTYWSNFIKTGNPNKPDDNSQSLWWRSLSNTKSVNWPAYTSQTREFLRFGARIQPDQRYRADMMALWLDLIPRLHSDASGNQNSKPPLFPPPPSKSPPPLTLDDSPAVPALPKYPPPSPPSSTSKPEKVLILSPEDLLNGASRDPGVTTKIAFSSTWTPVNIKGLTTDNVYQRKLTTTTNSTIVDAMTMLGALPMPLVLTVAIVSALIIGNIIICTVVYCVRRKRRRQAKAIAAAEVKKSSKSSSKQAQGKAAGNGRMGNGTSGNGGANNKYRGSAKTPEEIRPLRLPEKADNNDIGFRGSMRRFDIPASCNGNLDSSNEVRTMRLPVDGTKSSKTVPPPEPFDWRRQQHQQQLSAALNSTRNMATPVNSPGIVLNGVARKSHIIVQKCNSSGRLSVSLEDFTCSVDEQETGGATNGRFEDMHDPSPPPRLPLRPRPSQNDRCANDQNRSLLMRRNSLPKQLALHGAENSEGGGRIKGPLPLPDRPLASSSSALDQPPPGSPGQQRGVERELAPTSAIRLVNHTRIVTPPSSSSASASAASPPNSSSSAVSPSPMPMGSNSGARVNNTNKSTSASKPLPSCPSQEPTICFLPAYRASSNETNNSVSPALVPGIQDRALPPPPPPPKPKQLLTRYNQFHQQNIKVVKFSEETTEIPSSEQDLDIRALPPSPPMEVSSPTQHQASTFPNTGSNLAPRKGGTLTNWSKVAVESSISASPKKPFTITTSRVTGL